MMLWYKCLCLILFHFSTCKSTSQTTENDLLYLKEELDRLKIEADVMRSNMTHLQNQLHEVHENDLICELKIKSMQDDLKYLNYRIYNTSQSGQHDRQALENILRLHNGSITSINNKISGIQTQIQSAHGKKVAFTATNMQDMAVKEGQTLRFEKIVQNIGGQYSGTSGVFTARTPGVYVFFFNIRVFSGSHKCWIDLVKDGQRVVISWTDGVGGATSEGSMGIMQLSSGNSVWLKSAHENHPCNIDDLSSFSGFLLYPN